MTGVWTSKQQETHALECAERLDVTPFGEQPKTQFVCGCGEAGRHTPLSIAYDELATECPPVETL